MPMSIGDLFKQSIENRFEFLEAKKREFIACTSERKRKALVVELIQLEPSHLAEEWILDQVIKMMKDRSAINIGYLKDAFISKGKRQEMTEPQRAQLAETSFLYHDIKQYAGRKRIKERSAVRCYIADLPASEDENMPSQPVEALEQRIKRYKKKISERKLPFPYYGLDFMEYDRGNEHHRIEFIISDKPLTIGEQALFSNTKITFHAKNKT